MIGSAVADSAEPAPVCSTPGGIETMIGRDALELLRLRDLCAQRPEASRR